MKTVQDLVKGDILAFAREPKNNPKHLDFPRYTISLIEHDYRAKTPAMWNAAYNEFGMPYGNVMLVGASAYAEEILDVLRADGKYLGGGAGVGFKDEVVRYLDELEPSAEEIGAVNFILKTREGKLRGYNTDGPGYAQSLAELFEKRGEALSGKKVLVLGAGGAGSAIAFSLAAKGMEVVVLNRKVEKAEALAGRINKFFGEARSRFGSREKIWEEITGARVVVSAIDEPGLPLEEYAAVGTIELPSTPENIRRNLEETRSLMKKLERGTVISDIALRKKDTATLCEAKKLGFVTLDGEGMVVNQGVEAFWLVHGGELQAKNINKEKLRLIMATGACS